MSIIATLVAKDSLSRGDISQGCDIARGAAGAVLDERACSIAAEGNGAAVRAALEGAMPHLDIIVRRADPALPGLLIADMDSTMITVECIDELADYAGIKPQIAAITERAMRGELDFRSALTERVACLAGMSEGVIAQCLAERVQLMPGARTMVRTLTARGARAVLVSGGFTRFAEPVAEMIGFHRAIANVLEIADGVLTGKVIEPIVDSATKLATLNAQCAELGIATEAVLAMGDGANDVPMIRAAGLGIAYYGHPAAVEAADSAIRHTDHLAMLYSYGIARADWVVD